MNILGVSAFYHDSAAALIRDSEIAAAAQEDRFSRTKHDARFPRHAIAYCLREAGLRPSHLDYVAFYDKPFLKFERLLETYLSFAPRGFRSFRLAIPVWLREKLFLKNLLVRELNTLGESVDWAPRLLFAEHHLSHAASAFYPSPFEEAAVLTLDGVGEWATCSMGVGRRKMLSIEKEIHFPHSLGLLYSAFTYYLGFKVNSGEYKVMGLAPYGEPRYVDLIYDRLIDVKEDGSFSLDQSYFDYSAGLKMTSRRFEEAFGGPPRTPDQPLTQRCMDLATSVQAVTEGVVLKMARATARETGLRNLCLAGGVALNCVANGRILRDGAFRKIWIQPAAGDAGGALGAALAVHYGFLDHDRAPANGEDDMRGSFLGPSFAQADVEERLAACGARFEVMTECALLETCADDLVAGKALGWFQGRMEFGPRALGSRSILADARSTTMQSTLNLKVKFRESFRPFAPSVLAEDVSEWFELEEDSPYMLLVANVKKERRIPMTAEQQRVSGIDRLNIARSEIPAVTHVDYSARIQTVHAGTNPRYHALLSAFKRRTGCPVLVNTSFNVRGEPIVGTPEDAFRCFMGTQLDALAIGNCYLRRERQDLRLKLDYRNAFQPD